MKKTILILHGLMFFSACNQEVWAQPESRTQEEQRQEISTFFSQCLENKNHKLTDDEARFFLNKFRFYPDELKKDFFKNTFQSYITHSDFSLETLQKRRHQIMHNYKYENFCTFIKIAQFFPEFAEGLKNHSDLIALLYSNTYSYLKSCIVHIVLTHSKIIDEAAIYALLSHPHATDILTNILFNVTKSQTKLISNEVQKNNIKQFVKTILKIINDNRLESEKIKNIEYFLLKGAGKRSVKYKDDCSIFEQGTQGFLKAAEFLKECQALTLLEKKDIECAESEAREHCGYDMMNKKNLGNVFSLIAPQEKFNSDEPKKNHTEDRRKPPHKQKETLEIVGTEKIDKAKAMKKNTPLVRKVDAPSVMGAPPIIIPKERVFSGSPEKISHLLRSNTELMKRSTLRVLIDGKEVVNLHGKESEAPGPLMPSLSTAASLSTVSLLPKAPSEIDNNLLTALEGIQTHTNQSFTGGNQRPKTFWDFGSSPGSILFKIALQLRDEQLCTLTKEEDGSYKAYLPLSREVF